MFDTSESAASSVSGRQPLVPVLRLDTRPLPPRTQYAAWQDICAPLVDLYPDTDPMTGFPAELLAWDIGGVALVCSSVPALQFRRTAERSRADGLDHWVLTTMQAGEARVTSGRGGSDLSPGGVAVHSLGGALEGRTTAMRAISLIVPRDFCREAASRLDAADGSASMTGLGQLLGDFLMDLDRCLPNVSTDEVPALLASIRSMLTACVSPTSERLAGARQAMNATTLERARQLIQRRLRSPALGADEICRELGVSRSRLYRMFEPMGGVVHYIRHRRLLDAHAALANPEDRRPIVNIAAERGFIDAAEFSRAFKREFGYRPSDARNRFNVWPLRRHRGVGAASLPELLRRLQ